MTQGSKIASAAAGLRCLDLRAMLILTMLWSLAPGAVHADTLLLQNGESIEGSIVDATRNSVVVRRAIGGMRQMRIRDIAEVRIDLAGGVHFRQHSKLGRWRSSTSCGRRGRERQRGPGSQPRALRRAREIVAIDTAITCAAPAEERDRRNAGIAGRGYRRRPPHRRRARRFRREPS